MRFERRDETLVQNVGGRHDNADVSYQPSLSIAASGVPDRDGCESGHQQVVGPDRDATQRGLLRLPDITWDATAQGAKQPASRRGV